MRNRMRLIVGSMTWLMSPESATAKAEDGVDDATLSLMTEVK